ncbi:MAG: MarR family winged helix-turn-helix transcriptional regulator [Nakamurella sp.]
MPTDSPWLSTDEQRLWRTWTQLNSELTARLQRQMQQGSKLSMSDYEVLVHLTESPSWRMRASKLAGLLQWERSRLSHHIGRMERRRLVERSECAEDGRGAFVAVTATGRTAIERAAPGHVAAVRRLVLNALDPSDAAALTELLDKVRARLNEQELVNHCDGSVTMLSPNVVDTQPPERRRIRP